MIDVLVIGSINIDLVAPVQALPRAGETVSGGDLAAHLGGKGANQAVAAARSGAVTAMIGAVGRAHFGLNPLTAMAEYGVDTSGVITTGGPTGAALIGVDAKGENQIIVSPGANAHVLAPTDLPAARIGLSQMETPPMATAQVFAAIRANGGQTMLNAAPAIFPPDALIAETDILIVNETELATLSGCEVGADTSDADLYNAMRNLSLQRSSPMTIIATLGSRGALTLEDGNTWATPAFPAIPVDTTGAGDCFCGALAACLAEGKDLDSALKYAACAAAISTETHGAAPSMPDRAAIIGALR
ncbi:MAG: ribokinase [Pikeienuella sp.]